MHMSSQDHDRSRYVPPAGRTSVATAMSISVVITSLAWTISAMAQEGAEVRVEGLEEVIVTAERRESTIQKTPVSLTAVTAEDLAARGAKSMDDVLTEVPGITGVTNGPGQTQWEMRGMSPGASGGVGGTSGTVGFYVDDISLEPPAAGDNGRIMIDPNVYDLARVEVLRGPQGTLYGSSSMGGTVKLVTNLPDMSGFTSSVQLLMGTTDGGSESYGANAMLNVPLGTDRAALRVVAGLQEYGGWIDRIVVAEPSFPHPAPGEARGDVVNAPVAEIHRDDNTTRVETVRASLAFKATDNLTITPRFMYSHTKQEMPDAYDSPPGSSRDDQLRAVYQAFDIKSSFTDTLKLAGLTIDAQLGDINITAISSAWNRETLKQADNGEGLTDLYGMPSYYTTDGLGVGALSPTDEGDGTQYSQEIRVSSTGSGNFSWVVGGYYADFEFDDVALLSSPGFTSFTAYGEGFFPSEVFFDFRTNNVIKQSAAFANITYALPYNFELRAGARYYKYDTEFDVSSFGSGVGSLEPIVSSTESSEDGVSPSVTLSYLPTEDFTAYATVSQGFRPGGGNFPVIGSGPAGEACQAGLDALGLDDAPASYESDSVTNYELGEKWRLFDRRVTLNAAVFLLKWDGVQQPVILGGACGSNFVVNGPDAEVKGGEAELSVALLPELTLSATASYNDAKFVESDFATSIEEGDRLVGVPEWTTTAALEYRRPIATGDVFVRASHREMDSRPRPDGSDTPFLPPQSMTNLRLGWVGDRYSVNLSVDNVFDHVMDNGDRGTICCGIPNGYRFISTNRPRSFSVDLTAQF